MALRTNDSAQEKVTVDGTAVSVYYHMQVWCIHYHVGPILNIVSGFLLMTYTASTLGFPNNF